ncbi:hypothetical protein DTO164E3_2165 [Paecilomyces variotii]|nr:hypothetical protein DTO164E3_2165 [Paecilomyces variotii]
MAPRGFTNPAPKTDSARSALSSFTCTLCNKSYSRHPEYEAHIGSYDHQHRKRLRDLKQLSRDPNAAERAKQDARKADEEAGLRVVDTKETSAGTKTGTGGGFKKGGFKSSFTTVKGPAAPAHPVKKNVLADDDEDESTTSADVRDRARSSQVKEVDVDAESDTDEEYYDPRRPTDCPVGCAGMNGVTVS